ncbi:LysR family transcriptional regulator [Catellatospora vulcania]|uniref:LysR family transcriptional regulator n=1 Tax=Catellatospora vulcania TaxID=1460450 RepID=UPI0018B00E8A|nr:LysR family transcriptional regulator [Catellatospora vulcania]
MDLDLAQVRAFVRAADELHFGRAAAALYLTQQALSKRVRRLEETLGTTLFVRGRGPVELTAAGTRFLPHGRELLALGATAARSVRGEPLPLKVDVWGPVHRPLALLGELVSAYPDLLLELSMRRSLGSALDAVVRGDLDVAWGRAHDLGRPWPAGLRRRLVCLEPIAAGVLAGHPLADAVALGASELREHGLWMPFEDRPPELTGLLRAYAAALDVPITGTALNIGVEHTLAELRRHPHRVTPLGAWWQLPADVVRVPLRPVPYLPWSVVWRADNPHPLLPRLLKLLPGPGTIRFDPDRDWLPEPDRADLPRVMPRPGEQRRLPVS